jgi:hypothetical protein
MTRLGVMDVPVVRVPVRVAVVKASGRCRATAGFFARAVAQHVVQPERQRSTAGDRQQAR